MSTPWTGAARAGGRRVTEMAVMGIAAILYGPCGGGKVAAPSSARERGGRSLGYAETLEEVRAGVPTVTLNRPDKLNAWTAVMGREVRAAMREDDEDDGVRVVVLTGAGRGFCAGADMGLLSGLSGNAATGEDAEAALRRESMPGGAESGATAELRGPYAYSPPLPKPVLAALNGATAGLGLVISLYCDVRFASDTAVFTTAFARRGLIAEHGVSWMLPRLGGLPNARGLLP